MAQAPTFMMVRFPIEGPPVAVGVLGTLEGIQKQVGGAYEHYDIDGGLTIVLCEDAPTRADVVWRTVHVVQYDGTEGEVRIPGVFFVVGRDDGNVSTGFRSLTPDQVAAVKKIKAVVER